MIMLQIQKLGTVGDSGRSSLTIITVKPLSLTDLALSDAVTLNKKTVASILDVPAFVVGAGEYKVDEWNNFINTRIRQICNVIEQELTKKLLINPGWYFPV